MSGPISLHWLPESLCAQMARELDALLAGFCGHWGLPAASAVQVSPEAHVVTGESDAAAPTDPAASWTNEWRDAVAHALFAHSWLTGSAILRGVLDRIEADLHRRMAGKFGDTLRTLAANHVPGHAGVVCRFDWLQCDVEQRLSCAQLRASGWLQGATTSSPLRRVDLEQALRRTTVPLVARLGTAAVNVGDLLHLAPGDILLLAESLDEPLRVSSPGSELSLKALLGSTAGPLDQAGLHRRGLRCLPH